jgi:hypothetical protein
MAAPLQGSLDWVKINNWVLQNLLPITNDLLLHSITPGRSNDLVKYRPILLTCTKSESSQVRVLMILPYGDHFVRPAETATTLVVILIDHLYRPVPLTGIEVGLPSRMTHAQ